MYHLFCIKIIDIFNKNKKYQVLFKINYDKNFGATSIKIATIKL